MLRLRVLALPLVLLGGAGCGRTGAFEASPSVQVTEVAADGSRTMRTVLRQEDGSQVADGPSETRYPNGELQSEGEYRRGERSGLWRTWHPDGNPASVGAYLEGKPEGVWIHRRPDGSVDDESSGVYEDGVRTKDWWEEGARIGQLKSGLVQRSEYRHGLRNGASETRYESGALHSRGDYESGLRTGVWVFWNEDGTVDADESGYYRKHDRVRALKPAELETAQNR